MAQVRDMSAESGPLTRRGFLVTTVSAGFAFGFPTASHAETDLPMAGSGPPASPNDVFEPTLWYAIDRDGIVTVNIIRAEMGQHVGTALARILADELEVEWDKVRIVHVDTDPKWGLMVTGGSWSVWQSWPVLSRAGAAGRTVLIEQGAKLMGVAASECAARDGAVISAASTISYGEIVRRGARDRHFTAEDLAQLPIKAPSERRLVGKPVMALDIVSKTNGAARYGIDASVAGMVYARPRIPPTRNGSKVSMSISAEI